jgi:hypothetical protein
MAFGFRSSLALVTVILSCRRRSWCGKQMASCPSTDSLALPCLETWGSEFMLPNHRRYLIPSRPDPTWLRVKIQILAPQGSCHARPIYQKVLHTTGSRIVTSRHEASKTVWDPSDPAGDPCRTSPAHSVTNATNQKKGRDAQANRRGCQRAYEETSQLSRDKKRFHICDHFGGEYCIGIRISPNGSVHAKHTLYLAEALASPARAGNAVIYFTIRSEFGIPDVVH